MAVPRFTGFKYSLLFSALLIFFLTAISPVQAERPFPKPEGLVNDFAGVIPPAYKTKIAALTGELLKKTGIPIVVVTLPDMGGAEYNDYANRLYSGLRALGLPLGPSPSPVVAVALDDRSRAINCWSALLDAGVYANLVVPPASPSTNFLLRNSVSAAHSSAQIDAIIAAYAGLVDAGLIDTKQDG